MERAHTTGSSPIGSGRGEEAVIISDVARQARDLMAAYSKSVAELRRLKAAAERDRAALDELTAASNEKDARIAELDEDLRTTQAKLDDYEALLRARDEKADERDAELDELRDELAAQRDRFEAQVADLTEQLTNAQERLAAALTEVDVVRATTATSSVSSAELDALQKAMSNEQLHLSQWQRCVVGIKRTLERATLPNALTGDQVLPAHIACNQQVKAIRETVNRQVTATRAPVHPSSSSGTDPKAMTSTSDLPTSGRARGATIVGAGSAARENGHHADPAAASTSNDGGGGGGGGASSAAETSPFAQTLLDGLADVLLAFINILDSRNEWVHRSINPMTAATAMQHHHGGTAATGGAPAASPASSAGGAAKPAATSAFQLSYWKK